MTPYVPVRPDSAWRTLDTPHFVFHYPAALDEWTRDVAAHAEAERDAVRALVGYAPPGRTTVLVADPYNDSNGSAYPFLHGPAIFLWPVPPDPRDGAEGAARWARQLVVHEFAHLAHLTRPSRNPLRGRLAALLPTNIGPIGAHTPRWVWEGYATYVEGRLAGARPAGVWRPAFLRTWALEGRLPNYVAINGTGGFAGGSFAYLAGSAYLEWLVAQRGDSSLPHVWRRLTARTPRSFDAAFAGVFPGTPAELYARWSAQVTAEAVAAERALRAAPGGVVEGTLVQRLRGATGDPAVSPDGARVALVVRVPGRSSRIVVWRTGAEPPDTSRRAVAARASARRERARDPEDVPAIAYLPPPRRALATLPARDGRSFRAPRWLPDTATLLVERDEPLADGRFRPDLWTWHTRTGALRRVTHGAAVRGADPSRDGRSALATRCTRGWCDLVRVDLTTGAATMIAEGAPTWSYARPRWAPSGSRFAVSVLHAGRWRVLVGDAAGPDVAASLAPIGPNDGAARYEPTFLDDSSLAVTSERGGVPNVERIALRTGAATPLTRVVTAAMAPEPIAASGALYFLALRSTGLDLRRLTPDAAPPTLVTLVDSARVGAGPAADVAATAVARHRIAAPDDPAPATIAAPRAYGLGPQRVALLPSVGFGADGVSAGGVVAGADPVGQLTWVLAGAFGEPATWRGGSLSAALRAIPRVTVDAQLFGAAQRVGGGTTRYHGALLAVAPRVVRGPATLAARAGGSLGTLGTARDLAFADARVAVTRGRGDVVGSLALAAAGAAGRTADTTFRRWLASAGVSARTPLVAARASYARGAVSADAPAFERFTVGGPEPSLLDAALLAQRLPLAALPTASLGGRRVEAARVALGTAVLEPFAWAARTPDVSSRWTRVVGAEASFSAGPIPFARAPGVRAVGGVGYPLDGPARHRVQLYFALSPRP